MSFRRTSLIIFFPPVHLSGHCVSVWFISLQHLNHLTFVHFNAILLFVFYQCDLALSINLFLYSMSVIHSLDIYCVSVHLACHFSTYLSFLFFIGFIVCPSHIFTRLPFIWCFQVLLSFSFCVKIKWGFFHSFGWINWRFGFVYWFVAFCSSAQPNTHTHTHTQTACSWFKCSL